MTDDPSEAPLDEASADCIATAIVDVIGTDRLTEAEITPEQLADADSVAALDIEVPDDTTSRLADGIADCGVGQAVSDVLVGQFSSEIGGELPEDAAGCIEDAVDEQSAAQALAATFVDGTDDSIQSLMVSAVGECPEVMTAVVIAEAPGPVSPEDAACIQGVIEDNRDVVMAALVDQDQASGEQLGRLIVAGCPSVAAAFAGG
jgi:hypothetical protein